MELKLKGPFSILLMFCWHPLEQYVIWAIVLVFVVKKNEVYLHKSFSVTNIFKYLIGVHFSLNLDHS